MLEDCRTHDGTGRGMCCLLGRQTLTASCSCLWLAEAREDCKAWARSRVGEKREQRGGEVGAGLLTPTPTTHSPPSHSPR
jgi:hypothetical protein